MSGGHFNYPEYQLNNFINNLTNEIKNNKTKNEYGYSPNYNKQTITLLKKIIKLSKITSNLIHSTDYLYSGDDSEETFQKEVNKELKKLEG